MGPRPLPFGQATEAGQREANEDSATALALRSNGPGASPVLLAAVADGMGGHAAGDVASRTAIEVFTRCVVSLLSSRGAGRPDLVAITEAAFAAANDEVHQRGQQHAGQSGMGTTLTTALAAGGAVCLGHMGDSRAYLLRAGQARQLTRDHTRVQEMVNQGVLTPQEAHDSPQRNVLTRALGTRSSVAPDLIYEELQEGDLVVLCSDGLHHSLFARESEMLWSAAAWSRGGQETCQRLVAEARRRDGSDNITAACLGIGESAFGAALGPGERYRPSPRRALKLALATVLLAMGLLGLQLARPKSSGGRPQAAYDVAVMLTFEEKGAVARWPAAQPIVVKVAGKPVTADKKVDLASFAPISTKRVEMSLRSTDGKSVTWVLTRAPVYTPNTPGFRVNSQDLTKSASFTANPPSAKQGDPMVRYMGTADIMASTIDTIKFNVAAKQDIPVEVSFQPTSPEVATASPTAPGQKGHGAERQALRRDTGPDEKEQHRAPRRRSDSPRPTRTSATKGGPAPGRGVPKTGAQTPEPTGPRPLSSATEEGGKKSTQGAASGGAAGASGKTATTPEGGAKPPETGATAHGEKSRGRDTSVPPPGADHTGDSTTDDDGITVGTPSETEKWIAGGEH